MKKVVSVIGMVIGFSFPSVALSGTDVKGSKDHPLISRYKDSYIMRYSETDYDEYKLATGPLEKGKQMPPVKSLEGKITTIIYSTNTNTESVLKVYRNYEHAINKAGFKTLFSCTNADCGHGIIPNLYGNSPRKGSYLKFDPYNVGRNSDYRFLTGVLQKNDQTVYISLLVTTQTFSKYPIKVALDIIEVKEMELDLVTVNADSLAESLSGGGKAVLDGIYFDTDKAVIKKESDSALAEIAKYLEKYPKNKVFVVGHTDNTGSYEHNLELSRQRAEAVVNALVQNKAIARDRLTPVGIGEVSPQTSNSDEAGRTKNRRVEMVLRSN